MTRARVAAIPVHEFEFKRDKGVRITGFIAHELAEHVPEAVIGTKDEIGSDGEPVYQSVDQSKLVPLLMAALQETMAEVVELRERLAALEDTAVRSF